MVQVSAQPAEPKLMGIAGLEGVSHLALSDYWIDRYEVTNRQYKKFLAAGGYRRPEFWKEKFRQDGRALAWVEAMALLRDSTGQPGPATWVQGDYPAGQDDFPVTGVSWYEAAAYAGFAGRQLPTFQHWFAAAAPTDSAAIIPASNFGGQAVARVGQYGGMSWCGTYDMAGNVKEWCRNEDRVGRRMIMGGGWNEPEYMFNDADARAPFERKANFGFRCARYETSGDAEQAERPITLSARDFRREKPVAEPLFRVYKSFYAYDKTPLKAVVEKTEESAEWRREETSFAAAYGSERVLVILLLPKHGQPPYQTVVYHPTADAIRNRNGPSQRLTSFLEFLIRSGRAVAMPVYKGTYARGDGLEYAYPNTSNNYRDHVIAWSKDLGRTIDYLETRPDIASGKLAFMGVSWGGAMGLLLPALEPRIKACVLVVPGFYLQRSLPEVDQLNFAPRVTAPVLMLSGRFDFLFPVGLSQLPAFDILGTPKENKRRVVYEMDHALPPRNELIKETLGWLDRYLGPVN
jgi:pimeloyl-ACP methyl ester carboxylesterase